MFEWYFDYGSEFRGMCRSFLQAVTIISIASACGLIDTFQEPSYTRLTPKSLDTGHHHHHNHHHHYTYTYTYTSRRVRNRACRRITIVKKWQPFQCFVAVSKLFFKKKSHFSCVWQPFHTKSGPFFALPVSVIIVHVDLCCFFSTGQDTTRFPISIARIECIQLYHYRCQRQYQQKYDNHYYDTLLKTGNRNTRYMLTSPPHPMLSVASVTCSTSNER